jgi:hypothetical protein
MACAIRVALRLASNTLMFSALASVARAKAIAHAQGFLHTLTPVAFEEPKAA